MRAYSEVNVMEEFLRKPEGFLEGFFSSISKRGSVTLKTEVPARFFLKGELICETIGYEVEQKFNQSDLAELLIDEVLYHYSLNPNPLKIYSSFQQISSLPILSLSQSDRQELKVTFKKKQVLELEMLLADIDEVEPNDLTVEKVLQLQYVNFINDLITGYDENVIKRIIKLIKE